MKQSEIYRQNLENCEYLAEGALNEPTRQRYKLMEAAWSGVADEQGGRRRLLQRRRITPPKMPCWSSTTLSELGTTHRMGRFVRGSRITVRLGRAPVSTSMSPEKAGPCSIAVGPAHLQGQ